MLVAAFASAQTSSGPTSSPSPAPPILDGLNAADLEKAISLIQEKYVHPAEVTGTELSRATLDGLLDRLGPGATLLPGRAATSPTPAPFYREIIAGHIGYLRPGDLNRAQLQELDTTLRAFAGKKIDALVLDLRGCMEMSDYAAAAEFAGRFVAKSEPLFELRGPSGSPAQSFVSKNAPSYSGILVVLVDQDTVGAAEALAAVLRHNKAITIGQKTAGRPTEYSDLSLPSGKILRLAVAEAVLPGGETQLAQGLTPDLTVALPEQEKTEMFQQSQTKGMEQFVFETDRPHFNEAALLAGTNPEIEAAEARQRRARGERPGPHDPVLQRAVDVVTSIAVYEKQPGKSP